MKPYDYAKKKKKKDRDSSKRRNNDKSDVSIAVSGVRGRKSGTQNPKTKEWLNIGEEKVEKKKRQKL